MLSEIRARIIAGESIAFNYEAGMTEIENWSSGYMEYKPNGTATFTIRINGGARNDKEQKR